MQPDWKYIGVTVAFLASFYLFYSNFSQDSQIFLLKSQINTLTKSLSEANSKILSEQKKISAQLATPICPACPANPACPACPVCPTEPATTTPAPTGDDRSAKAFTSIYQNNQWGPANDPHAGNGSGSGSAPEFTMGTRRIITEVIAKYQISSLLDAPCGAMVWMSQLLPELQANNSNFKYMGVDVVEYLIANHRQTFAQNPQWTFQICDVTYCQLPSGYELIFSRDALQHWPYELIFKFLENVKKTDAKYLLVGSYLRGNENNNHEIQIAVQDFLINLLLPPFSLPAPLETFSEGNFRVFPEKWLVLWDMNDVRNWQRT